MRLTTGQLQGIVAHDWAGVTCSEVIAMVKELLAARARIAELEQTVATKTSLQEAAEAQLLCVQVQLDAERARASELALEQERRMDRYESISASRRRWIDAAASALPADWNGTPDDLHAALLAERDAAYERGRAEERAAVEAYVLKSRDRLLGASMKAVRPLVTGADALDDILDELSAGEHLP